MENKQTQPQNQNQQSDASDNASMDKSSYSFKFNEKVEHQEGKIRLMDGIILDCYPLSEDAQRDVNDTVSMDTTGEYLIIGKKKRKQSKKQIEEEQEKALQQFYDYFCENAFYLLDHRDRILSDSRMFLAHTPDAGNLAYMGAGGFMNTTLGVFIEFWTHCPQAIIAETNKPMRIVTYIAGSPLSGCNSCTTMDEDGKRHHKECFRPFIPLWRTFLTTNLRYTKAKGRYQAYTLQQVVEILRQEDENIHYDAKVGLSRLDLRVNRYACEIEDLNNNIKELKSRLEQALLEAKRPQMEEVRENFRKMITENPEEFQGFVLEEFVFNQHYKVFPNDRDIISEADFENFLRSPNTSSDKLSK